MKKTILLAMVSILMLVSVGGCLVAVDPDGRGGRGGWHERDGGHSRDHRH